MIITELVNLGANVNARDRVSALQRCWRHAHMARHVAHMHAPPRTHSVKLQSGFTALHHASALGSAAMASALLRASADVNVRVSAVSGWLIRCRQA